MPQINIRVTEKELKEFYEGKEKVERAIHGKKSWKDILRFGIASGQMTTKAFSIASVGLSVEQREEVSGMIQEFFERHVG
jgi:hypothetical protein